MTSLHYDDGEIPWELSPCVYQFTCGRIGFARVVSLKSQDLPKSLSADLLYKGCVPSRLLPHHGRANRSLLSKADSDREPGSSPGPSSAWVGGGDRLICSNKVTAGPRSPGLPAWAPRVVGTCFWKTPKDQPPTPDFPSPLPKGVV